MKVKNVSDKRVGVVGFGDIKPGETVDMPKKVWTAITKKKWPDSKPYRCEAHKSLKVVLEKKKKRKRKTKESTKSKKPVERAGEALETKHWGSGTMSGSGGKAPASSEA